MMDNYEVNYSPVFTRELFKETMSKILEDDCVSDPQNSNKKMLLFAEEDSSEMYDKLPEHGDGLYLIRDEDSNPYYYRAYVWDGDSWQYADWLQGYQPLDKVVDILYSNGDFNEF
jgi:hypothetical protein